MFFLPRRARCDAYPGVIWNSTKTLILMQRVSHVLPEAKGLLERLTAGAFRHTSRSDSFPSAFLLWQSSFLTLGREFAWGGRWGGHRLLAVARRVASMLQKGFIVLEELAACAGCSLFLFGHLWGAW